jgi:hypothetical protein
VLHPENSLARYYRARIPYGTTIPRYILTPDNPIIGYIRKKGIRRDKKRRKINREGMKGERPEEGEKEN